jgi:hypothetical protein
MNKIRNIVAVTAAVVGLAVAAPTAANAVPRHCGAVIYDPVTHTYSHVCATRLSHLSPVKVQLPVVHAN